MDGWLINGEPGSTLSANDRGLHYGDGLFETIAVRNGTCRFLDSHLERLATGCRRLSIPSPDATLVTREIAELTHGVADGAVKIIVTRGAGKRGYAPPENPQPVRLIGFAAAEPQEYPGAGVRLCYCATRIGINPALAGMKTLNRLEQVLARQELTGTDFAEGLMCNVHDQVVCGTMSNLFAITAAGLVTPDLTEAGVNGIMRAQVMSVAESAGIATQVRAVTAAELAQADGIFISNSLLGIWPVAELADTRYDPAAGCMQIIRQGLAERGVGECA
jgi:4-amino-4-deoxychorismate lyase